MSHTPSKDEFRQNLRSHSWWICISIIFMLNYRSNHSWCRQRDRSKRTNMKSNARHIALLTAVTWLSNTNVRTTTTNNNICELVMQLNNQINMFSSFSMNYHRLRKSYFRSSYPTISPRNVLQLLIVVPGSTTQKDTNSYSIITILTVSSAHAPENRIWSGWESYSRHILRWLCSTIPAEPKGNDAQL